MEALPLHLRAYVFIMIALGCASVYTLFVYRYKFLVTWILLWITLTSVAFFSGNIWILILTTLCLYLAVIPRNRNKQIVYYFLLLPTLPLLEYIVPGIIPGVSFLFELTYPRLLCLIILLPLFIIIIKRSVSGPQIPGRNRWDINAIDFFVILYFILLAALSFRNPSLTSSLRAVFYLMVDILIPYFVISRYVQSIDNYRQILMALLFTAIMLSFVALIEVKTHWWLYSQLRSLFDTPIYAQDFRSGYIRTITTMIGPIEFGYFLTLALSAWIFLRHQLSEQRRIFHLATLILISLILFFTNSRGAWIATFVLISCFLFLKLFRPYFGKLLIIFALLAAIQLPALMLMDFSGYDEHGTFAYRIELIQVSIEVIKDKPWFGYLDVLGSTDKLEVMKRSGHIDIVNSYIQIGFNSGVIGLILFSLILFFAIRQIYKLVKKLNNRTEGQILLLGNLLLAMLVATAVMIATVSSVGSIPIYYWSLFALCSAYIRMLQTSVPVTEIRPVHHHIPARV